VVRMLGANLDPLRSIQVPGLTRKLGSSPDEARLALELGGTREDGIVDALYQLGVNSLSLESTTEAERAWDGGAATSRRSALGSAGRGGALTTRRSRKPGEQRQRAGRLPLPPVHVTSVCRRTRQRPILKRFERF